MHNCDLCLIILSKLITTTEMQDLTRTPSFSEPLFLNPFHEIIFSDQTPLPGNPKVHQSEMARCVRLIEQKVALTRNLDTSRNRGELISISAPTAGFGKSHLIKRISSEVLNRVSVIDLPLEPQTEWSELLDSTIQQLESNPSVNHVTSLSKLDEAAAFFLAHLIHSAISGEIIEKQECPSPISIRKDDYFLAFGGGARSKIYSWLDEKIDSFASLAELPEHYFNQFSRSDVVYWANYFVAHFRQDNQSMKQLIGSLSFSEAKRRTVQLLQISSNLTPLLIVVDHLDSCHGSDSAGMEIATIVTSISESLPNSVLIFSINEDLWQSVFEDNLPSAIKDRMNGENLELEAINANDAADIIIERLTNNGIPHQLAYQFSSELSEIHNWRNSTHELFPRKIIKQAMVLWDESGDKYSPPTCEPVVSPNIETQQPVFDFSFIHLNDEPAADENDDEPILPAFTNPVEDLFTPPTVLRPIDKNPIGINAKFPDRTIHSKPVNGSLPAERLDLETSPNSDNCYSQPTSLIPTDLETDSSAVGNRSEVEATESIVKESIFDQSETNDSPAPMEIYFDQLEEHFLNRKEFLTIDLSILEGLIRNVGNLHDPLDQNELSITGGQSVSVKWRLSNHSVYMGFEPTQNKFFYGNLLQKITSLPNHTKEKIVSFTHESEPFNEELLTINGFDRETLHNTFDIIQLSNEELALMYAAAKFFKETINKNCGKDGLKLVLNRLNPLWQRICKPI